MRFARPSLFVAKICHNCSHPRAQATQQLIWLKQTVQQNEVGYKEKAWANRFLKHLLQHPFDFVEQQG